MGPKTPPLLAETTDEMESVYNSKRFSSPTYIPSNSSNLAEEQNLSRVRKGPKTPPLPAKTTDEMESVYNSKKFSSPTYLLSDASNLVEEQNMSRVRKGSKTPPLPAETTDEMETANNAKKLRSPTRDVPISSISSYYYLDIMDTDTPTLEKHTSRRPRELKRSQEEWPNVDPAAKKYKLSNGTLRVMSAEEEQKYCAEKERETVVSAEWAEYVRLFLDIVLENGYDEEIEQTFIRDLPAIVEIECLGLMKKEDYVRKVLKTMKKVAKRDSRIGLKT